MIRSLAGSIFLCISCVLLAPEPIVAYQQPRDGGSIEYETRSSFSHIRVRRSGSVRTLIFVRDSGEEAWESQMNLRSPHVLRFTYLQHMFSSYLLQPQQSRVMIVGLGGGSMVHFLQKYDPQVKVEAVEIDPVVVELAERYFSVRQNANVRLVVADAFEYLKQTKNKYDVIYMDAFLKPSADTDQTGVPLRLRTQQFYNEIQQLLVENGSVVFNINPHPQMQQDLQVIAESFPQTYVFALPNSEGVVAVGSLQKERLTPAQLKAAGKQMDGRFKAAFSFEAIAGRLRRQN
ncbi:MAG: Spermidine synthase [Planctomycetota bacterium]|jgi:spermidine synthase